MPDITKHLPLAALQPFFELETQRGDDSGDHRRRYFACLDRIVHPALIEFFKELKAEGGLNVIPNSQGYSCRNWDIWNAAAKISLSEDAAKVASCLDDLAALFAHDLVFSITYPYRKALESGGLTEAALVDNAQVYAEETLEFNEGRIHPLNLGHQDCMRTGLPLLLRIKNWVGVGKCILNSQVVDVPPAEPEVIQESKITFKTGNLLASDWFRLEAFKKLLSNRESLNSRKGCEALTKQLIDAHSVIRIQVSNSSPVLIKAGNQVMGGFYDDEDGPLPTGFQYQGTVCTGMWAITLVEYETLVDIVAHDEPENAKAIVDAYLADADVTRMTVNPGDYYVYYFGEYEEFADRARAAGMPLPVGHFVPYFVMAQERLLPAS